MILLSPASFQTKGDVIIFKKKNKIIILHIVEHEVFLSVFLTIYINHHVKMLTIKFKSTQSKSYQQKNSVFNKGNSFKY